MTPAMPVSRPRARGPALAAALLLLAVLGGCALPAKPQRPALYDFGPGPLSAVAPVPTRKPALVLAEVEAPAALDSSALLYRLGYADVQQLRPYAQARWSMPPAQLLRQRLREALGRQRPVLGAGEGGATLLLRVELEEFSQLFESPERSQGLVRLSASLVETATGREQLLAQTSVVAQRPAASADAPGGVRALTEAADAAVQQLVGWLDAAR